MSEALYLLVSVGGQRVALPADHIESVVEIDQVTPVPRVAPHVAGLFALRSRVLTVIDAATALGLPPPPVSDAMPAVIVGVSGHPYAVLVDEVHDVMHGGPPAAPPARLTGGWAAATIGLVEGASEGEEMRTYPLIDPAWLVAPPQVTAAA